VIHDQKTDEEEKKPEMKRDTEDANKRSDDGKVFIYWEGNGRIHWDGNKDNPIHKRTKSTLRPK
jgi:hypothetical protein